MERAILVAAVVAGWLICSASASELVLPKQLEGIHPGMPVTELLKKRPAAQLLSLRKGQGRERGLLKSGTRVLIEEIGGDLLFSSAMYEVRDGKLHSLILTGRPTTERLRDHRLKLIQSGIKRWGDDYEKQVVRLVPGNKQYLAPLLLWNRGEVQIALTCTPGTEETSLVNGVVQLNIFRKAGSELHRYFRIEDVDRGTTEKLFASIGIER